jgi:isopentenyl diphosphate isomerase/L-lactate dehydrogenase-like FMN-dependent dehydrogenase
MRRDYESVFALRDRAKRVLPRVVYEFIEGGADDEVTVQLNRSAFAQYTLRPRMATHVGKPDLRTSIVGQQVSMPILTAPCGMLRIIHPDAEGGVARAAAGLGTTSIVSAMAGTDLGSVVAGLPDDRKPWFQLYALGGSRGTDWLLERAESAGCPALVVTVDTPVAGNRERDIRNRVPQPLSIDFRAALSLGGSVLAKPGWFFRFLRDGMPTALANIPVIEVNGHRLTQSEATALMATEYPGWPELARIRSRWGRPLVIKGVLTAEDAQRCVDIGADAVVISNHGGRQLDSAPATIEVLPEIVAAVGDRIDVLVDGGFRRGTDIIKALALGAKAVLVGRPYVWGLGISGEAGVTTALRVLRNELIRDMRLMGCHGVRDLDETWIQPSPTTRVSDAVMAET